MFTFRAYAGPYRFHLVNTLELRCLKTRDDIMRFFKKMNSNSIKNKTIAKTLCNYIYNICQD